MWTSHLGQCKTNVKILDPTPGNRTILLAHVHQEYEGILLFLVVDAKEPINIEGRSGVYGISGEDFGATNLL